MPSHKLHTFTDRMLFGRSFWKLHKALDKPVWVLGRKHRVLFHDVLSATAIAKKVYPGDPVAEEAALVHIELDDLCTYNREFHQSLKKLAKFDALKRKRAKTRKGKGKKNGEPPIPDSFRQVEKTCKQLLKIKELTRRILS